MGSVNTGIPSVGIRSIGLFRPAWEQTAAEIAAASGIAADVLERKFGLSRKTRARPDEPVSELGRRAAEAALQGAGLDPLDIDLVIFHGSQYKDMNPWSAACRIQACIGARRAAAFELNALCAGAPIALKTAAALMQADAGLRRVLLVAATREGELVDYTNQRTRFLFNLADGAAAVILERDWPQNQLLGSAMRSDGSFSLDVVVPPAHRFLEVPDPPGMKERLDPISLRNFFAVIDDALAASGLGRKDVGFLAATHMKRSIQQALLDGLGLTWEQSYYLSDWGHLQSADQYIALHEGARLGSLRPGSFALLAAAGTGYTWSAAVVRWGEQRG